MEPINWLAVVLGAVVATAVGAAFGIGLGANRLARGTGRIRGMLPPFAVMLIASAMLGHNFARIGAAALAAKPWLYFMQSGGVAIAFVIPALLLGFRKGAAPAERLFSAIGWLFAYLAIGAVSWALG